MSSETEVRELLRKSEAAGAADCVLTRVHEYLQLYASRKTEREVLQQGLSSALESAGDAACLLRVQAGTANAASCVRVLQMDRRCPEAYACLAETLRIAGAATTGTGSIPALPDGRAMTGTQLALEALRLDPALRSGWAALHLSIPGTGWRVQVNGDTFSSIECFARGRGQR